MNLKIDQIGAEEKLEGRLVRFSLLNRPEDQKIYFLRGRLAAVFEVDTTGSGVDKLSLKKIAEDILLQHYFSHDFLSAEGAFKEAFSQIEEHFKKLGIEKMSFAAAAVLQDLVYVARKGECGVVFFRNSSLEELKGITADSSKMQTSSGKALEGDILVLTAGAMEKENSLEDFLGKLQKIDPTKNIALFLYFEAEKNDLDRVQRAPSLESRLTWWHSRLDLWRQGRAQAIYIKPLDNGMKRSSHQSLYFKVVIAALLILLGLSTFYTIYKTRKERRGAMLGLVLGESRSRLDEAESLVGLNNEKARKIVSETKLKLEEGKKLASKAEKERIEGLLAALAEISDRANNVAKAEPTNLHYDLTLKEPGSMGRLICFIGEKTVVLDSSGRIWFVSKQEDGSLKVEIFSDKSFPNVQALLCADDKVFIMKQDNLNQLTIGATGEVTLAEGLLGEAKDFIGFSALAAYFGNLYFLKPSEQKILKYTASGSAFSLAGNYLSEGEDITGAVYLAIDGNVYTASGTQVKRFEGGQQVLWDLKNLPSKEANYTKVVTSPEMSEIYLLNQAVNQIWVFNKDGFYMRQVKLADGGRIDDFTVGNDSLFVLSGSKIYKLSLFPNPAKE
jgi:hypothetical protein